MLDNQLMKLVANIIATQQAGVGLANLIVKQAFQPTQQGVNTVPTCYWAKIPGDRRLGYPYKPNVYGESIQTQFTGTVATVNGVGILTVSAMTSGAITLGTTLAAEGAIDAGSLWVTGYGTGAGGVGTYTLNNPFVLASPTVINGISGMTNQTIQQYESTFQMMALATQNPSAPGMTSSDILNLVAGVLQTDSTVTALEAQGVGILRITDVRNPPFLDDRNRFEFGPNFDFTLTHKQVISQTIPVIETETFQVYSV